MTNEEELKLYDELEDLRYEAPLLRQYVENLKEQLSSLKQENERLTKEYEESRAMLSSIADLFPGLVAHKIKLFLSQHDKQS